MKFASVNENSLHAATDNNDCLFTFWVNSEWSCEQHTGLFTIRCVYLSVFYSLMWMHLKEKSLECREKLYNNYVDANMENWNNFS